MDSTADRSAFGHAVVGEPGAASELVRDCAATRTELLELSAHVRSRIVLEAFAGLGKAVPPVFECLDEFLDSCRFVGHEFLLSDVMRPAEKLPSLRTHTPRRTSWTFDIADSRDNETRV